MRDRVQFLFLNFAHFVDHFATLIFATVAALVLTREWGMSYADLTRYATPGFIAFGLFSLPAGWLADRWSREGMIGVFFVGIGLASILTAMARTPFEIACGLFVIGMFAAIYHPVGLAMVIGRYAKAGMALAINGVWGNFGVAFAAMATGFLIDFAGWRAAFYVPGLICVACGVLYFWLFKPEIAAGNVAEKARGAPRQSGGLGLSPELRRTLIVVTVNIFVIIIFSGFIFQSTSFALPKVFAERLGIAELTASWIGSLVFIVFAVGSIGQLVIGRFLDQMNTKMLLAAVVAFQTVFLALMPGLGGWLVVPVAAGFLIGTFGQLPITDYMVGKMARPEIRSSVFGARYVVTCLVFGLTLPLVAWIYDGWGFDRLFWILSLASVGMFAAVMALPGRLPDPDLQQDDAEGDSGKALGVTDENHPSS